MSFYRTILAAVAAVAFAVPVFADDTANTTPASTDNSTMTQPSGDNSAMQSTSGDPSSSAMATEGEKVNVNKASAKELMKVKGLNAAKARAIVAYRKKHGDFKSLDDLMNVKGFKKMKADKMKEIEDQLTTE